MTHADSQQITAVDRFAFHVELIVGVVGLVVLLTTALARTSLDADTAAIMFGIGSSLLATAIATYLSTAANRRTRSSLQGMLAVYKRRAALHEDVYREHIDNAVTRIWVQGCQLHRFLQRNEQALENAARRGVEVRFLLMSQTQKVRIGSGPELSFSELRTYEEHEDWRMDRDGHGGSGRSYEGLWRFINRVNQAVGDTKMEVKEYVSTSSSMLFILDNSAYVGPYLHLLDSGEAPTFFIQNGALLERFATHFRNLWHDSRFTSALPAPPPEA